MAGEWYYTQNNQQQGPVTLEALQGMAGQGQIQRTDLVWRQGMANWQPAGDVPGVFGGGGPQAAWQGPPMGGGPGTYGQPGYGGYQVAATGESYKSTAVTAFVVSIVGLFICGLILGIIALTQANKALNGMQASGNYDGKGLAVAARVIGIIDLIGWGIFLFLRFANR